MPFAPTFDTRLARLFDGGTFFRSRATGSSANSISISVSSLDGYSTLKVSTTNFSFNSTFSSSNHTKPGTVVGIRPTASTVTETITLIAISQFVFNVVGSTSGQLGKAKVGDLFKSTVVSFQIQPTQGGYQINDKFIFTIYPGTESYTVPQESNDGLGGMPSAAAALRIQVNEFSKLITMPERGTDAADSGGADDFLFDFNSMLAGGSGLPINAAGIDTGPKETYIHINYEEDTNGLLRVISSIYSWVGPSKTIGSWVKLR